MTWLKQFWCGLTTRHDYGSLVVTDLDYQHTELTCVECGHLARSRNVAVVPVATWGSANAPQDFRRMKRVTYKGPVIPIVPETARFDFKAHAATRKHGPNGQFLPAGKVPRVVKVMRKRKLSKAKKK